MNCDSIQERLLELFGLEELPAEIVTHLAHCPACRQVWRELQSHAGRLGNDELFHISGETADTLTAHVDARLGHRAPARIGIVTHIRRRWYGYAAAAAAAVLVLGLSIDFFKPMPEEPAGSADADIASVTDLFETDQATELNQTTVDALLYDFTAQHSSYASELLLDDLTEEEMEYLKKSFDVKELL